MMNRGAMNRGRMTRDPQVTGQKQSQPHFAADREKQVTQTVGTKPEPSVRQRSASAPADSVPPAQITVGPYSDAWD